MQAEILIALIEGALQSINYDYKDIDYLAFTNGPGSFTGIRIGLAECILVSSNLQGVTISNFEMSYYRLQRQIKLFDKAVILLNPYRNQLYYQEFEPEGNKGQYGLIDINEVSNLLGKKRRK
jgi:tRNA threonylcarbamoyladenosine biosynthesis protein TsaB